MNNSTTVGSRPEPDHDAGVTVHRDNSAIRVLLHRPGRGNSLAPTTVEALHAAVDIAESSPGVSALILEARGRAFCAGVDVDAVRPLLPNRDQAEHFFDRGRLLTTRLATSPLVVVAAVDGLAAAGGLELVAACDLVLATRRARFADRHVRNGFVPAFGATARLVRRVGSGPAAWLLLGDAEWSAEDAQRVGLVSMIVQDDEALHVEIEALVGRIGGLDTTALRVTKSLLAMEDPADAMERERVAVGEHLRAGRYG